MTTVPHTPTVASPPLENTDQSPRAVRQWIGDWREKDTEEAFAAMVRRYLDAYGPATPNDFAHWFGIPLRPARERFGRMADELVAVDVEGQRAWMTPAGAEGLFAEEATDTVRLLPGFDPYTIGALLHLDRLLPGPLRARISRTSGWISPVLLVDGRIAVRWQRAKHWITSPDPGYLRKKSDATD